MAHLERTPGGAGKRSLQPEWEAGKELTPRELGILSGLVNAISRASATGRKKLTVWALSNAPNPDPNPGVGPGPISPDSAADCDSS